MYFFIYLTTNLINNKQYVGFHSTNNINDGYLGSGKILRKSIKKYGQKNFKREILEFCNSENWQDKEIKWIFKLNTLQPIGYNITEGGQGSLGRKLSKESIKKISESKKGQLRGISLSEDHKEKIKNSNINKKRSPETCKRIGESKKGNIWNVGRIHSDETKINMSINHADFSGSKNPMFGKKRIEVLSEKYGEEKAKKMEEDRKIKLSKKLKGKKKRQITKICPHCRKMGKGPNMSRYHFNKCKNYLTSINPSNV